MLVNEGGKCCRSGRRRQCQAVAAARQAGCHSGKRCCPDRQAGKQAGLLRCGCVGWACADQLDHSWRPSIHSVFAGGHYHGADRQGAACVPRSCHLVESCTWWRRWCPDLRAAACLCRALAAEHPGCDERRGEQQGSDTRREGAAGAAAATAASTPAAQSRRRHRCRVRCRR